MPKSRQLSSAIGKSLSWLWETENYAYISLIRYIYQNYMKISWNTLDEISQKSLLALTTASRWVWNLLQVLKVSLFKLVNATVILAFSSSLVLDSFIGLTFNHNLHNY